MKIYNIIFIITIGMHKNIIAWFTGQRFKGLNILGDYV